MDTNYSKAQGHINTSAPYSVADRVTHIDVPDEPGTVREILHSGVYGYAFLVVWDDATVDPTYYDTAELEPFDPNA